MIRIPVIAALASIMFLMQSASDSASGSAMAAEGWRPRRNENVSKPRVTLPAEFEKQDGLLVMWKPGDPGVQRVILDVVVAARRNIPVILLVNDECVEADARRKLERAGVRPAGVNIVRMPINTVWARDYGPMTVTLDDGTARVVDMDYSDASREEDDAAPLRMAALVGLPIHRVSLSLEGGNLISNGAGVLLTTTRLVENNLDRGCDEADVARILSEEFGGMRPVFLEPLKGEGTGHVDIMAAFTDARTVVVGRMSPEDDPVNARILDDNARRLAKVQTKHGRLRVFRIPMPRPDGRVFRTYTNVCFANGALIVPEYASDRESGAAARRVYERLLPGWRVVGVESSRLITLGGAVHCVTMNLPRLPRMPDVDFLETSGDCDDERQQRPAPAPFQTPSRRMFGGELAPQPVRSLRSSRRGVFKVTAELDRRLSQVQHAAHERVSVPTEFGASRKSRVFGANLSPFDAQAP